MPNASPTTISFDLPGHPHELTFIQTTKTPWPNREDIRVWFKVRVRDAADKETMAEIAVSDTLYRSHSPELSALTDAIGNYRWPIRRLVRLCLWPALRRAEFDRDARDARKLHDLEQTLRAQLSSSWHRLNQQIRKQQAPRLVAAA